MVCNSNPAKFKSLLKIVCDVVLLCSQFTIFSNIRYGYLNVAGSTIGKWSTRCTLHVHSTCTIYHKSGWFTAVNPW